MFNIGTYVKITLGSTFYLCTSITPYSSGEYVKDGFDGKLALVLKNEYLDNNDCYLVQVNGYQDSWFHHDYLSLVEPIEALVMEATDKKLGS